MCHIHRAHEQDCNKQPTHLCLCCDNLHPTSLFLSFKGSIIMTHRVRYNLGQSKWTRSWLLTRWEQLKANCPEGTMGDPWHSYLGDLHYSFEVHQHQTIYRQQPLWVNVSMTVTDRAVTVVRKTFKLTRQSHFACLVSVIWHESQTQPWGVRRGKSFLSGC